MKVINGILILENGDSHEAHLPEGLALPIFTGLHASYVLRQEARMGKVTSVRLRTGELVCLARIAESSSNQDGATWQVEITLQSRACVLTGEGGR